VIHSPASAIAVNAATVGPAQLFVLPAKPVTINSTFARAAGNREETQGKEVYVADTKKIADKAERKKLKRTARKKAAPKAKRTTPRGSLKKKVKKMVRGQSKR
jgi:hypothetical protein